MTIYHECRIPSSLILQTIEGVYAAALAPRANFLSLQNQICTKTTAASFGLGEQTFGYWSDILDGISFEDDEIGRQLARMALSIALIQQKSRMGLVVSSEDLSTAWSLIYTALTYPTTGKRYFKALRSSQGFLSVPLCSVISSGRIEVLFRLHVWLPDGLRGRDEFAIHSHQTFAQSWILAGKGTEISCHVHPELDPCKATHAEFKLAWGDGKRAGIDYKTHPTHSFINRTDNYVSVDPTYTRSEVHTPGMSYSVPAGAFHRSVVAPSDFHSTLFFFDASRGFIQDAPVLGPKDVEFSSSPRGAGVIGPCELAQLVEAQGRDV